MPPLSFRFISMVGQDRPNRAVSVFSGAADFPERRPAPRHFREGGNPGQAESGGAGWYAGDEFLECPGKLVDRRGNG